MTKIAISLFLQGSHNIVLDRTLNIVVTSYKYDFNLIALLAEYPSWKYHEKLMKNKHPLHRDPSTTTKGLVID